MSSERIIRRYSAYFPGWAQAFGTHDKGGDEQRNLRWLFGEDQVGLILTHEVKRFLYPRFLGDRASHAPTLELTDGLLRIESAEIRFDESHGRPVEALLELVQGPGELHLYQTYHLIYPSGTRIITLSRRAPLPILYREISQVSLQLS